LRLRRKPPVRPLKIDAKRLLPLWTRTASALHREDARSNSKRMRMRIVSLLPSVTEILFAIGAGADVVGVTHECDFPAQARMLPQLTASLLPADLQTTPGGAAPTPTAGRAERIDRHVRASVHAGSSLYALDAAALDALAPDVIITQELCAVCAVSYEIVAQAAKRLRGDGPTIISLEPSSLADVYATMLTVGEIVGAATGAAALVASLRERERALRERPRPAQRPRVLVLEWTDPPMSGGHWTPGLVELAGGEPILANPGGNSQRLEWDAIVNADPDVIIVAPCGYDLASAKAAVDELAATPAWRTLRAVTSQRAYAMDGNAYVNRPGPRLIDTAELFALAIAERPMPAEALVAV
jgi:iron complex transport system substrate-binding protein